MSYNVFDLQGTLSMNMGPFNRGLQSAHRQLKSFQLSLHGLQKTAASVVPMLGAGLTAGLTLSARAAISAESALTNIRKTTGLTKDEAKQLEKALDELSLTLAGIPRDSLSDIAFEAGKLGIKGVEDLTEFTRAVAMIGIAIDDLDPNETATRMTKILHQFHLGTGDALSFASALNKLSDTSTATARDILQLTNELGKTASYLHMTAQQTLAMSTAMIDAGVKPNQGATAMNAVFKRMATSPEKFAKLLGMTVSKFKQLRNTDPFGAVKKVLEALAKNPNGFEAIEILDEMKLRGEKASSTMLALSRTIQAMDKFLGTANSEWKTHASLEQENAEKAEDAASKLRVLSNLILITARDIGAQLLPSIKNMSEWFVEGRSRLDDLRASFGMFLRESQSGSMIVNALNGIRDAFTDLGVSGPAALDLTSYAMRHWDNVTQRVGLDIFQFLKDIPVFFGAVGEWVRDNFPAMMNDAMKAVLKLTENMVTAVRRSLEALTRIFNDAIKDPSTLLTADWETLNPMEFWNQTFDLSDVKWETSGFQMPTFDHSETEKRKQEIADQMAKDEEDYQKSRQPKPPEEKPKPPEEKPKEPPKPPSGRPRPPIGDEEEGHGGRGRGGRGAGQGVAIENMVGPSGTLIADMAANRFRQIDMLQGRARARANAFADAEIRRAVGEAAAMDPNITIEQRREMMKQAPDIYRRQFIEQQVKESEMAFEQYEGAGFKERQMINAQRREMGLPPLWDRSKIFGFHSAGVPSGTGMPAEGASGEAGGKAEGVALQARTNGLLEQLLQETKENGRRPPYGVLA